MATVFCALWLDNNTASKLAVTGGELPSEMHITLFMADVADYDVDKILSYIRGYVSTEGKPISLSGMTTGAGAFTDMTGDSGGAFHVTTNIAGLLEYRRNLVKRAELFASIWNTYEYNPHITVKYLNSSEPLPYTRAPIIPLSFSEVVVRVKPDGEDFSNSVEYHFPMNPTADVVVNIL